MTFRLKSFTFSLFFLCVGLLFAAPESKKKTILSFWTFQEIHTTFMKDAVESWNTTHPNEQIELKMDVLPYDDLHNKLLISLQAGVGAPDIVDIEISKFANFIKSKNPPLVPLNKYLKNDLDKIIIGRMDSYKKDGNYYGIV